MSLLYRVWRCLFVWNFIPGPEEGLQEAQLIVTQSCSRGRFGTPGKPNRELASVAVALQRRLALPVFSQEEVAMAESDLRCVGIAGGSPDGKSTLTWNTAAVARMQVAYCREKGITHVVLVATCSQMNRARWVYERMGLKVTPAPVSKDMRLYLSTGLVHRSHRFLVTAYLREFLARIIFLLQGKI